MALVGVARDDGLDDEKWLVSKMLNGRFFEDEAGKMWKKSVMQSDYEVLLVSQFTLHAYMKGNKPDFHRAMGGDDAKRAFDSFVEATQQAYDPDRVKEGVFGAHMKVQLENDGPITVTLDSRNRSGRDYPASGGGATPSSDAASGGGGAQ